MSIKKIMTAILIAVALMVIAFSIAININFFKEISPLSPEPEGKPVVEDTAPELNYAIPSAAAPTGQITVITIDGIVERRKALEERELEAERTRAIRRAEAFARQKEAENTLLSEVSINPQQAAVASPAKEEDTLPTDKEMKKMEEESIISF
jgi:hypothetical protein